MGPTRRLRRQRRNLGRGMPPNDELQRTRPALRDGASPLNSVFGDFLRGTARGGPRGLTSRGPSRSHRWVTSASSDSYGYRRVCRIGGNSS
jgi:hypothetical protein